MTDDSDKSLESGKPSHLEAEAVAVEAGKIPFYSAGMEAPTIYADVIRGALFAMGVARLNLVEHRLDSLTNEIKAVRVATIALPMSQVKAWGEYLLKYSSMPTEEAPDAGLGPDA